MKVLFIVSLIIGIVAAIKTDGDIAERVSVFILSIFLTPLAVAVVYGIYRGILLVIEY